MRLLIRAWKQGVDIAGVYMPSLYYSDWSGLPRAPIAYVREAKSESELRMELRAIGKGGVFARQRPHIVKPYKGDVKPGQPEVNSQPVVDNPEPEPYVDAADQQYGVARKGAQPNLQELLENAARGRTLTPPPYAQAPEPMPWDPQPVAENKPRRRGRPPRQSPGPAKASSPLTPPSSRQETAAQGEPTEVNASPPPPPSPSPPELPQQEKPAKAPKGRKEQPEPPKAEARPRQEHKQEQSQPRSSRPQNGTVEVEQPPRDPDDPEPDPDDPEPSAAPPPPHRKSMPPRWRRSARN